MGLFDCGELSSSTSEELKNSMGDKVGFKLNLEVMPERQVSSLVSQKQVQHQVHSWALYYTFAAPPFTLKNAK